MAGAPSGTGSSSSQSLGWRMNGSRLGPAQAAVRSDELLERRDLAHLRVVLAEQQQVGRVGHRVLALEAHDRVRAEERRRVLALDVVLVEVADAARPEDHGAALARPDHQQPDARVRRQRGDEVRVELLELLDASADGRGR